jgi:hypothetical protein
MVKLLVVSGVVVLAVSSPLPATSATDAESPAVGWGAGSNNRLGTGSTTNALTPTAVLGPDFSEISAGLYHSCGISGGKGYCWGSGTNGRLGTGTTADSPTPTPIALAGVTLTHITAGSRHTCALDETGQAYCWGEGSSGRLGTGNTKDASSPQPVDISGLPAGVSFVAITAGWDFTCALDAGGAAYCWGYGGAGQLGNGKLGNRYTPDPVASGLWAAIDAGTNHTCAIATSGQAYCWGEGGVGQLGTGNSSQAVVPALVDSPASYTAMSAGGLFTCALTSAGVAQCWGEGESGRLGNDSLGRRKSPVPVDTSGVLAGRSLVSITAGTNHACTLDTAGLAYCWGNGYAGRLGNGSTSSARVPVTVDTAGVLQGRQLVALDAGGADTLALVAGGPVPTRPAAPTNVSAVPGDHSAVVTWVPGADGGAPIQQYVVTSKPGNRKCISTTPSCQVNELGNKREYAFVVTATNRIGTSAPSALSPTVVPQAPPKPPAKPKITLMKVRVGSSHARIRWRSEPADAAAEWQVMKRGGKFPKWRPVASSPARLRVYRDRRYVVKMRVSTAAGYSPVRVVKFRTK